MEVKHTPGPWYYRKTKIDGITNYDVMAEDGEEDPWFIAMVMKSANPDLSGKENAAFIVRACNSHYEMLEALRELYLDLVANDQDGLIEHVEPMRKARDAIAKAEGRL